MKNIGKFPNPSYYDDSSINIRTDKILGYQYFTDHDHPLSDKSGKVYYHRHIISKYHNKWIDKSYHVHHLNENKSDNRPENLNLVSPRHHARSHMRGKDMVKICKYCNKKFIRRSKLGKFCSLSCSSKYNKSKEGLVKISKEELYRLVWKMPTTKVAKILGCSDQAISKKCRKLEISKPPRGYWEKVYYKKD